MKSVRSIRISPSELTGLDNYQANVFKTPNKKRRKHQLHVSAVQEGCLIFLIRDNQFNFFIPALF